MSRLETGFVSVALLRPSKFALGIRRETEHVMARISTNEGIVGLGEASPFSPFCHETKASMIYMIQEVFSQILTTCDLSQIGKIMQELDKVALDNRFAKAVIDMSIYDLLGKKLRVPVYALLGGKHRDKIPVAGPISMSTVEDMVEEACKYVNEGFVALKVYVGLDIRKDLERIKAIRKAVGPDIQIKIDVNQRWQPKTAIKMIKKMEKYDLLLVEQPVPYWDLGGLCMVRKSVDTPIAVDESLRSLHDALEIVRREAADVFNVYVTKNGGLWKAKIILSIAAAAGIPCFIGSLYDLSIGTAAGINLACSLGDMEYPCDLIGPFLHAHDIVDQPIKIKDGQAWVSNAPGLGIGDLSKTLGIQWLPCE